MLYALIELIEGQEQITGERDYREARAARELKLLPNGNPMLRPLIADLPKLEWWQIIDGHSIDIQPDKVVKTYRVSPRPIEELQRQRKREVDALLLERAAVGMEFPAGSGKRVQLRPEDLTNIIGISDLVDKVKTLGKRWPDNFRWRLADNAFSPPIDPDQMVDFAYDCAMFVYRNRVVAWAHKDAIAALADPAAVVAYDITTGWE